MKIIEPGTILIADPFLKDPNFLRTVIFLCNHEGEGSFGFVLNRKTKFILGDVMNEIEGCKLPIYYGGPVQRDTVHFLHRCPGLITSGEKITDEIYWGGEFDEVISLIKSNRLSFADIRLFSGYSGWGERQLEDEMNEKTWLTTYSSGNIVFADDENLIWKNALKQLGGKYEQLINYPIDPLLN